MSVAKVSVNKEAWLPALTRDYELATGGGGLGGGRRLRYSLLGEWTGEDANYVLSYLRGREDLAETAEDQVLEVSLSDGDAGAAGASGDGEMSWVVAISGVPNITEYCYRDSVRAVPHAWSQRRGIGGRRVVPEYSDFGVRVESAVYTEGPLELQDEALTLESWEASQKYFRLIKRFRYRPTGAAGGGATYTVEMVREAPAPALAMKDSGVTAAPMTFRFYAEPALPPGRGAGGEGLPAPEALVGMFQPCLGLIAAALRTGILLSREQREDVLHGYELLTRKVLPPPPRPRPGAPAADAKPLFLAPKPFTLERAHLVDPDTHYGAISIQTGYAVTDKADGERMLLYVHDDGFAYLINNTMAVRATGHRVKSDGLRGSLVDGEFVSYMIRRDGALQDLFAAFDVYFLGGESVMALPLADAGGAETGRGRYAKLKAAMADGLWEKAAGGNASGVGQMELSVKTHVFAERAELFAACRRLLAEADERPYEMDGLVFTPAHLSVFAFYPGRPVPIERNMRWSRVFKWKPPTQNTIDFHVVYGREVVDPATRERYRELVLETGFNVRQSEPIGVEQGLRLRYDRDYARAMRAEQAKGGGDYVFRRFAPVTHSEAGVGVCWAKIANAGEAPRASNGDLIESRSIVEFTYDAARSGVGAAAQKRWVPLRVREDKTRLLRSGQRSRTANDFSVATSIWRTLHDPVTADMICGGAARAGDASAPRDEAEILLSADQIYYDRDMRAKHMLSSDMLIFHTEGVREKLYAKRPPGQRRALLELGCGKAGDMPRWRAEGYLFVLGVDIVRDNITNAENGSYAQMLRQEWTLRAQDPTGGASGASGAGAAPRATHFNHIFAIGDCSYNLSDGSAAEGIDAESRDLLRLAFRPHASVPGSKPWLKYVAGRASAGFDVVSCQFAIHYFFESAEHLNGFFSNVAANLRRGGLFIATFMDGARVHALLEAEGRRVGEAVVGRKLVGEPGTPTEGVPVWAIVRNYDAFDGTEQNGIGKEIGVYLEVTKRVFKEYLVHMDLLTATAKNHDLELVQYGSFADRLQELVAKSEARRGAGDAEDSARLLRAAVSLNGDAVQKKFSALNNWAIFRKL